MITKLFLFPKGVFDRVYLREIMSDDSDNDETIDALLKEALQQFEQCRHKLDKFTGRKQQHQSVNVSPFTLALEN